MSRTYFCIPLTVTKIHREAAIVFYTLIELINALAEVSTK